MLKCHGIVRRKARSQGSTAVVLVALEHAMRPRKAGLSSALDAPITSLVGLRAKTFAEPRLPEKVTKPVERAGAVICTNSVAEIMLGVPPRGATQQKSPDGMP